MTKLSYITTFLCLVTMAFAPPICASQRTEKQIVLDSFIAWENGSGSPFSLLDENATWTVMGPSPSSGTYTISELQKEIIEPFNARLKIPLKPSLIDIYQEDDTVIVLFEAQGLMINDEIYKNSYAWFFTMKNKKVIKVRAVLDVNAFDNLMALEAE